MGPITTGGSPVPAPLWFSVSDLVLAYLPMAWLGHGLATRLRAGQAHRA